MSTSLSTLTPVEHDLLYVERLSNYYRNDFERSYAERRLIDRIGIEVRFGASDQFRSAVIDPATPESEYPTCLADAKHLKIEVALQRWSEGISRVRAEVLTNYVAEYNELASECAEQWLAVTECHEEYESRPWNRYYLVTSSDGHIHSSTDCSTCNKGKEPTGFALVPYLSGSTVEDAVSDLGEALCSVCFPNAPVESREQVRISARLALVLKEQGAEAFIEARKKAVEDAQKRSADRCDGSGTHGTSNDGWRYACTVCGYTQRNTAKIRAHRRPRFYATKEVDYRTLYWDGSGWAPSTKKQVLASKEDALAIVEAHGGSRVRQD
jgi:hypothetical protein